MDWRSYTGANSRYDLLTREGRNAGVDVEEPIRVDFVFGDP